MAAASGVRKRNLVDYRQLHSLSSVVLYDNAPKIKKRGKFFEVDRILAKRKIRFVSFVYTLSQFVSYTFEIFQNIICSRSITFFLFCVE